MPESERKLLRAALQSWRLKLANRYHGCSEGQYYYQVGDGNDVVSYQDTFDRHNLIVQA